MVTQLEINPFTILTGPKVASSLRFLYSQEDEIRKCVIKAHYLEYCGLFNCVKISWGL